MLAATSPPQCPACRKIFRTQSGVYSHLRQRRNDERCIAWWRRHTAPRSFNSDSDSDLEAESTPKLESEMRASIELQSVDSDSAQSEESAGVTPGVDSSMERDKKEPEQGLKEPTEAISQGDDDDDDELDQCSMSELEEGEGPVGTKLANQDNVEEDENSDDDTKACITIRYTARHHRSRAGSVLTRFDVHDDAYASAIDYGTNVWAPFNSQFDWQIAHWAKKWKVGSTALSELLAIEGFKESLGLSYRTAKELNKIISTKLRAPPQLERYRVLVRGDVFQFYARDILECIRLLWRDPKFADDLVVEPERQYADVRRKTRVYQEMHANDWWWDMQKKVERVTGCKEATIVPVILRVAKTQLAEFHNKSAYPVYLTLGNIPKHIRCKPSRRAEVLVAYLPTANLDRVTEQGSQHQASTNLFQAYLAFVTETLREIGRPGITLVSGDGAARRAFPLLAPKVD